MLARRQRKSAGASPPPPPPRVGHDGGRQAGGAAGAVGEATARVLQDLDEVVGRHGRTDAGEYNADRVYLRLMSELLDAKAHALCKLRVFCRLRAGGCGREVLERARERELGAFDDERAAHMELMTGMTDFPWREVLRGGATADLGGWSPERAAPEAAAAAGRALAANGSLRAVRTFAGELPLRDGWAAGEVVWEGCGAVAAAPGLAALLLRNLTGLVRLSIRSEQGPGCTQASSHGLHVKGALRQG